MVWTSALVAGLGLSWHLRGRDCPPKLEQIRSADAKIAVPVSRSNKEEYHLA